MLTFIDKKYQKELCRIDLSEVLEDGQNISGISVGYMSDITIGENIYLYVTPGYQVEGIKDEIFYENMPTLKSEIAWEYDDIHWATYEIDEFQMAWMNENADAVLARIKEIDETGLVYDEVEWVNESGTRRTELRDNGVEVPEGIYIYNQEEEILKVPFSENCEFLAVTGKDHHKLIYSNQDEMIRRIKRERDDSIVYYLVIEEGQIVKLQEQYVTKY